MPEPVVLEVTNLTQVYASGSRTLTVLQDVTFSLAERETCAVVGPSGSGKTTLLGLCAGLDRASSGSVRLCGTDLGPPSENARAEMRNRYVGFVFQSFQLIPTLTAIENVMVPAELRGDRHVRARADDLLERVGLGDRMHHYPAQLSGGEQQRVALARAFINEPAILFADEPTGNLDAETGALIEDLLFELNRTAGTALVVVTHNVELARRTGRIIRLRGGRIVEDAEAREGAWGRGREGGDERAKGGAEERRSGVVLTRDDDFEL
ncbi:MAG TPA: ABC transporter ATP-binding protein [Rhodothermales bacterium]|nr:ABC transporter ATP-binding protein [Rhodothermales bacterium]